MSEKMRNARFTRKRTVFALVAALTCAATDYLAITPASADPPRRPFHCAAAYRALTGPSRAAPLPFSDSDLLSATVHLQGGGNRTLLAPAIQAELRKLASARKNGDLEKADVQETLLKELLARMGKQDFDEALGTLAGKVKVSLEQSAPSPSNSLPKITDDQDLNRGWGWKLLRDDDPAFQDPGFMAGHLRQAKAGGRVMQLRNADPAAELAFSEAWLKVAPDNVKPVAMTLTGTDANNLLYDVARQVVRARGAPKLGGLKVPPDRTAEILVFDSVYGGGGGRIAEVGFFEPNPDLAHLRIPSPHTGTWNPADPKEIARLEKLENQALAAIQKRVHAANPPVGGLLLESILGPKGVYFYRPEFLKRLRKLCDFLEIPIFADEVLTGGGRTGKFFAYQHYEDFEPDFVTFGKGLQVAGVAQVQRDGAKTYPVPKRVVTLKAYDEALLKSAQILNRIREGHLLENAAEVGDYWIAKLREHQGPASEAEQSEYARGKGFLIYSLGGNGARGGYGEGRLMPPLTFTKEDVDRWIRKQ